MVSVFVSVDLKPQQTLINFHEPNNYGEGGSKKFNNGTKWDEMEQNRTVFLAIKSFRNPFRNPINKAL